MESRKGFTKERFLAAEGSLLTENIINTAFPQAGLAFSVHAGVADPGSVGTLEEDML
jgi:hypothetical protein